MNATEYYDKDGTRKLICSNCGHDWPPIVDQPRQCPRCKTYLGRIEVDKLEAQWLSPDEMGDTCVICETRAAAVRVDNKKVCIQCLRKKYRI